jgi:AAHS family cis,cis-muconate transporter-like MFS transporter
MLVWTCVIGLAFTVAAATSPGYWWFVVIFAMGRPMLSATNALAQVGAAEETAFADRAKAIALVAAGYGVGSGLTAVIHGLAKGALGFRGVFALAVVPLGAVFFIQRWLVESDRFTVEAAGTGVHPLAVFGAVGREFRWRLLVVTGLAFAVSVITGPANSFIFDYAQDVLRLSGAVTAMMVVVAAPFGLAGLLAGRWLADRLGRRVTGAGAMVAVVFAAVLTYSGSRAALLVGYEVAVFSASTFAPAAGALANELVPTSVRASVAGWNIAASVVGAVLGLVAFGALAQVGTRFDGTRASLIVFLPVLASTSLFLLLPETKGREPEELWPGHL